LINIIINRSKWTCSSDQVVIDLVITTLTRATLYNMFLRHT